MAGLLICEPTKKPESFDSGFLLCPFQKGLQFHFLAQMAQHPLSGNDADEHAPVVHHGGEVLHHGVFQQIGQIQIVRIIDFL